MVSSAADLTSRLLRRERLIVVGGVALLALLGWWFVASGGAMADGMGAGAPPFEALVLMWWLMMMAMMLPSATPAILLYARVRQAWNDGPGIAHTWLFLSGYIAIWLLFSIAAAVAQLLLCGSMALHNRYAEGALLVAAGAYQLSPLKSACVSACRSPAQFISSHWRPGWQGAIRLGVLHGLYCLGCCWLLMALLFVGGVMNLLWVVGLTLIVAIEKLAPRGELFGRAAGFALIVWGVVRIL